MSWEDQLIERLPRPEDADDAEYQVVWEAVTDAIQTANISGDDPESFVNTVLDRIVTHVTSVRTVIAGMQQR